VKTVRFSKVVEKCGQPEDYLLLMDPAKDRTFQAAVKGNRVMTVFQETVGAKADRGEIGFQSGPRRQFLVFPKSLKPFEGSAVVGIKYDLLKAPELKKGGGRAKAAASGGRQKPKKAEPARKVEAEADALPKRKAKPAPPSAKAKPKREKPPEAPRAKKEKSKKSPAAAKKRAPKDNVVTFQQETKVEPEQSEDSEEIAELKNQVRHAMALLEEGKAVAAFNLLKRAVD
jgi:hypothetical protein